VKIKPVKAWAVVDDLYERITLDKIYNDELSAKNQADGLTKVFKELNYDMGWSVVQVLITPVEVY